MQGSLTELLDMQKSGKRAKIRREVARYVVNELPRFEVRRPDRDGSLDWP
jgi:hypothetical protein